MQRPTTTDPIADMLTRIRNAAAIGKQEISLPHSRIKESVAKLLAETNFIDNVKIETDNSSKTLVLNINHGNTKSRISAISKLSRPGRRTYVNAKEIPVIKQGRGIVIISTSRGLMTGDRAKAENVGGELICQVY